jgi:phosphate transport system substrate-binding protein
MGGEEANLPAKPISIMVPPPTSGTRDALGVLFVEPGLDALGLKASDQLREDGRAIEMGENDSLIIEKLVADPDMFGVFGFSFLEQNRDKVQASVVNGVELSFENISTYDYPGARPLFFYIKKAHIGVIPGMKEFVTEFVSEKAMGLDGYLFPAGLVPLTDEETEAQIAKISDL